MDLIVAEKPSVARDIARVVGASKRGDGFLEGPSHVVTWCIGHLVELEEPAHYDARWKAWRLDTLPMIPERFALRPVDGTRKQWTAVKNLLRDRRFARVVNACDAGREGELIFRHCYELAGARLPIARLWVSSLTDVALRAALAKLAPGDRYAPLADAARCRSEADWLVGMNATRALTVRSRGASGTQGPLLSVGRVQTPTLAMVVERERAIRAFVPKDYWEVFGDFRAGSGAETFRGRWEHDRRTALTALPLAESLVARASRETARVERVATKAQRVPPPLLFDLTTLQRRANTRFGWPAQKTLDLAQSLYENHKLITYPRTDSRHLSNDLRGELPETFDALATVPAYAVVAKQLRAETPRVGRRVFDDAKVSDHHAIIPTTRRPDTRQLSPDEARLHDMVARSFLAVFMPDAEFELTTIVVKAGEGEAPPVEIDAPDDKPAREEEAPERFVEALPPPPDRFIARGRVRKVAGWQEVAGFGGDDERKGGVVPQALPAVRVGEVLAARYRHEAKKTQAPKRYTEAGLLAAMESCGKDVDDDELRAALKEAGLGTPATRAATIETLLKRAYIARREKALVATPTGEALVAAIPVAALRSPELTGRWEARLARMARGEERRDAFMRDIEGFVRELVGGLRQGAPVEAPLEAPAGEAAPTRVAARRGGAKGERTPRKERAPKAPKAMPAAASRVGEDTKVTCPVCGQATLMRGNRAWGCARWREGCRAVIPYEYGGKAITDAQLRDLATKGATRAAAWRVDGAEVKGRLRYDAKATPALTLERAG
ncbi:MAG: DNA topoisomerase [Polyangiales bacterium]